MADKVFLHIGLPKTGTSYLQTILWGNREALKNAGVLLPGVERRDHLWASCVVRGDPNIARRNELAPSSWERVVAESLAWTGRAMISHEFFSSASATQAVAAVDRLAPAEVHLVVTARDTLDLFTSSWQESLKNKGTVPMSQYCASVSDDPLVIWNWRTLDLGLVLERWSTAVRADRIHVVTVPKDGSGPRELWNRFASILEVPPDGLDLSLAFANPSLGVVEAETLRRINATLRGFDRPFDRGVWIRTYLADERLVPRGGEKFWPSPAQVADCRRRGERAVARIRECGFDVRGLLEDLLTPGTLPSRRHPDSVTDTEVAAVAVELAGILLTDARRLTNELEGRTKSEAATRTASADSPVHWRGGLRRSLALTRLHSALRTRLPRRARG